MFHSAVFLCLCVLTFVSSNTDDVTVTTKYGQLVGTKFNITADWSIDTFLGIPYAEPPVGSLRWKKSVPVRPWTGVKEAKEFGSICWQSPNTPVGLYGGLMAPKYNQSEDCLSLNIYAPRKLSNTSLVPVMVFVHGGAFVEGAGLVERGTELAMKGVVLVTLNYRLGPLGFLSTEDGASPGNYGLLDQLLALQWVQDCIHNFGGDPNRVTLFGQSAGSASVSLLLTSPLSKGLFHAAICESGVGLAPWALSKQTDVLRPRDRARLLGIKLGCMKATTQEVIDCLRNKDARSVSLTTVKRALDRCDWTPVVETHYNAVPDLPMNSWKKGNVMDIPVIRGTNSGEWAAYVAAIQGHHDGIEARYFLDKIKTACKQRYRKNRDLIEKDIKLVYATANDLSTPDNVRDAFLRFLSDYLFTASIVEETLLDAKLGGTGKTYLYEFAYVTKNTLPTWEGAPHSYELQFVFGVPFPKLGSDIDLMMSLTMMDMWTNFAKYGNPTPIPLYGKTWQPFTSVYNQSYFYLDSSTPTNHLNFRYNATKLWNTVIPALSGDDTV